MAARKAASVLPLPVGGAISTCRPAWIAGHASACAGVGAAKVWLNHRATAGWKGVIGLMGSRIGPALHGRAPTAYGILGRAFNARSAARSLLCRAECAMRRACARM